MNKVIYITTNFKEYDFDTFSKLPIEEQIHIAKNYNHIFLFTLDDFQKEFNNGDINDNGYILII